MGVAFETLVVKGEHNEAVSKNACRIGASGFPNVLQTSCAAPADAGVRCDAKLRERQYGRPESWSYGFEAD